MHNSNSDRIWSIMKRRYTHRQGQYLAFIHQYTKHHRCPPAEADIQRYFRITAPGAHQMVVMLEKCGLIARLPNQPRTIRVLLPSDELADLLQFS